MKYNGMEPEQFFAEGKIATRLLTSTLYSLKSDDASNMVTMTTFANFLEAGFATYLIVNMFFIFSKNSRTVLPFLLRDIMIIIKGKLLGGFRKSAFSCLNNRNNKI